MTGTNISAGAMAFMGSTAPISLETYFAMSSTNVPLDKTQCSRLARMAATGLARHIIPAHMLFDGDIVFTLASKQPLPEGHGPWNELLLGALAADAVAGAVCRAARPGMFA